MVTACEMLVTVRSFFIFFWLLCCLRKVACFDPFWSGHGPNFSEAVRWEWEGQAGMVWKKSVWGVQRRYCGVADVTGYRLVLFLLQCDVTPGSVRGCCVEVHLCHFEKVLVLTN